MIYDLTISNKNKLSEVDPRIKLFFVIEMTILLYLVDNLIGLFLIALFPIAINIYLSSIKKFLSQIWAFKWYFILFLVINYLLAQSIIISEIILISLTFLVFFITFQVFSKTTNPDEVTDSLIKLRLPPVIAWRVGITLRQVYFIYSEIQYIRQVQRKYNRASTEGRFDRFKNIAGLITTIYANGITRASHFAQTLANRGYKEAHRDIITQTSEMKSSDIGYFILALIPLVLYIMYRSQVFIT